MNTKNNKRKQASAERIKRAFLDELRKKELQQIKVSDICKAADINRSTFYSAYNDIYDLAEKIHTGLENEVNTVLETETDWSKSKERFLKLLEHIKENRELYFFYFKLGYDSRKLKLYDIRDIGNIDGDALEYHVEFFKSGFNGIVKMWLENECREAPQQICDVLLYEYQGRIKNE